MAPSLLGKGEDELLKLFFFFLLACTFRPPCLSLPMSLFFQALPSFVLRVCVPCTGRSPTSEPITMNRGDSLVIKYSAIRSLLADGAVELA